MKKETALNRWVQKKIASGEKEAERRFATQDEADLEATELELGWLPESGLNRGGVTRLSAPEPTADGGVSAWFAYTPEHSVWRDSAHDVLDESGVTDEGAVKRLQERFEKFNNGITVPPENLELTKGGKLKSLLAGVTAAVGATAAATGVTIAVPAIRDADTGLGLSAAALTLGGAGILAASLFYNNRLKARRVEEFLKAQKDYKAAFSAGLNSPETDYDFIGDVYKGKLDPTIANVAKARGMINAAAFGGERYRNMIKDLTEIDLEKDIESDTLDTAEALGRTLHDVVVKQYMDSDNTYPAMSDIGFIERDEEE